VNNAGQYEVVFFQRTGLQGLTRRLGVSIFLLLFFCGTNIQAGEPTPEIEVFVRAGCPHCEAAKAFLKEIQRERPVVRIAIYDIAEDSTTRQRLATLAEGEQQPGEGRIRSRLASSPQVAYLISRIQ